MRPICLNVFCGAGGASVGLHRAGFEVTGCDIEPQPNYPFAYQHMDALELLKSPEMSYFDFIWASPPCQRHSTLKNYTTKEYADLIAPVRRLLIKTGLPYIIENVPGAPLIKPVRLCGTMFGLRVFRHRIFESNVLLTAPEHKKHEGSTGTRRWPYKPVGGYVQVTGTGGNYKLEDGKDAMGIDWMKRKSELSESIPPAYSEYLGRQIIDYLEEKAECQVKDTSAAEAA